MGKSEMLLWPQGNRSELDENSFSGGVSLAHKGYLLRFLFLIILVNTDCVNPENVRVRGKP